MAFQFKILNGADPDAQYAAIETKATDTFYLLSNGKGYFGETELFGGSTVAITGNDLITDLVNSAPETETNEAASAKAIVDYVVNYVSTASVLSDDFFRDVQSYTVLEADLTNESYSLPDGTTAGETGLLFTADTDAVAGGETYYFVPLTSYLDNLLESVAATDTVTLTMTNGTLTADVNIDATEGTLISSASGLAINSTGGAVDEDTPSSAKVVTEADLVAYMANFVRYSTES